MPDNFRKTASPKKDLTLYHIAFAVILQRLIENVATIGKKSKRYPISSTKYVEYYLVEMLI